MKIDFRIIRNAKGAVIITVLVAATAGALALAGLSGLALNSVKSARTAARDVEANVAMAAVREALRDPLVCQASLGGRNPNLGGTGNAITQILRGGNVVYQIGDTVVGQYNRISGLRQVSPLNSIPAAASIGASSSGEADFVLELEGKGAFYGSQVIGRRIRLIIHTDGLGRIADCSSAPYQRFNDCVYPPPATTSGTGTTATCPAGYFATGGGYADGDISNDSFTNTITASGTGWRCYSNDGDGRVRCHVICCR